MKTRLEYMRLRAAIDRNFTQFAGIYDELVQMKTEGLLSRKHEPAELKTLKEKLIDRMGGPKRALENLIRETSSILGSLNNLTKGAAPAERSSAYGYRGELEDRTRRLLKEAQDQLKAVNDWINAAHGDKSSAGGRSGQQTDGLDELRTKHKEFRTGAAMLTSPKHDVISGPTQPVGDPIDAILTTLILLVTVFTRKSQAEKKSLGSSKVDRG